MAPRTAVRCACGAFVPFGDPDADPTACPNCSGTVDPRRA